MQKHQDIYNNIINKNIYLGGFQASAIKNRIEKRLEGIMKFDEEFSAKLEKYIENTYHSDSVDEYTYIDNLYNLKEKEND